MNKKFSINEIIDAVNSINSVSNHQKAKKPTTEKILQAVNRIYNNETTIEVNSQPNEITVFSSGCLFISIVISFGWLFASIVVLLL